MARAGSSGNHSPAGAQSTASAREVERGSNGEMLIAADIFLVGPERRAAPRSAFAEQGGHLRSCGGGDIIPGSMPVDMFPEHVTLGARGADCRDVPAFDAPAE